MRRKHAKWCLFTMPIVGGIMFACFMAPNGKYNVKFDEVPSIKPHNRYHWLTSHKIKVSVNDERLVIPANFDTDLASIPRWYWIFLAPAYSAIVAPSILHDYLYSCPNMYSRRAVDEIFYYSLVQNGVTKYTAYKMYFAVRLFGAPFYNDNFCLYNDGHKHISRLDEVDYE